VQVAGRSSGQFPRAAHHDYFKSQLEIMTNNQQVKDFTIYNLKLME